MTIDHASQEKEYALSPHSEDVRLFLPNGRYFGNVCALDPLPAKLRQPKTLEMLRLLAELVGLRSPVRTAER